MKRKEMFAIIDAGVNAAQRAGLEDSDFDLLVRLRDDMKPKRGAPWKSIVVLNAKGEEVTCEPIRARMVDERVSWWKQSGFKVVRVDDAPQPERKPRVAVPKAAPAKPTPKRRAEKIVRGLNTGR